MSDRRVRRAIRRRSRATPRPLSSVSGPPRILLAPGASAAALRLPAAQPLPPIDERLVRPETRDEVVRGQRVLAMPANPSHADRHCELDFVIRGHVAMG